MRTQVSAVVLAIASVAMAQPVVVGLGQIPNGQGAYARGMNADGSVVVGRAKFNDQWGAMRWTAEDGMHLIGTVEGPIASEAYAVSDDGRIVVGWFGDGEHSFGFRWTPELGARELRAPEGWRSSVPWDISGDGRVIVGTMQNPEGRYIACRWVDDGIAEPLGLGPGEADSVAYAVSHNGKFITGSVEYGKDWRAFLWSEHTGMQVTDPPVPESNTYGSFVSNDGRTIIGYEFSPTLRGIRWRPETGWQYLHDPYPWTSTYAWKASANGTAIVGGSLSLPNGNYPIYYRDDLGVVFLDWQAFDIDYQGLYGRTGDDITPDGTIMLVNGSRQSVETAFLIVGLPRVDGLCLPDFTDDGMLDMFDVQSFLSFFAWGSTEADLQRDGVLDFFDLQAFLTAFAAGCEPG